MQSKVGKVLKALSVFALPVALFALFSLLAPGFGLKNSLRVVTGQAVIPAMLGYGMAFCMAAGLFDLSAGTRVIFTAAFGGMLTARFGIAGLITGSLIAGILSSTIMALLYNWLRIPSLVLSLGCVMLLEILSSIVMDSAGTMGFLQIPPVFGRVGKDPWNYIICLVFAVLFYLLFYKTKFSSHLRAVGDNEILARNMGIKSKPVYFIAYVTGGVFLGVAGVLQIGYSNSVSAVINMSSLSLCFQPMMGVIIGIEMCALFDNMAVNIIVGELCISTIFNGLIALGLSSVMQSVFLGVFMIVVMAVSANKELIGRLRLKLSPAVREVS